MNKSDSIIELAKALCKAQNEMSGASKAKDNPFFKSKYADLSEVIKAIKAPFANNGLSYSQFPIEDNGRIGVETILMHESGEWLSQSYTVQLDKQNAQGAGSAITYCRRYALQAIAGIPSEDDDGNQASQEPEKPWYNDFETEKDNIASAMMEGMSVADVVNQLEATYKISKKTRGEIQGLYDQIQNNQ